MQLNLIDSGNNGGDLEQPLQELDREIGNTSGNGLNALFNAKWQNGAYQWP